MHAELKPHPDFPAPAGVMISVEAAREGDRLILRYLLSGETSALAIPSPSEPLRTDGLWRRTCFEAFVQPADEPGYVELNFSPSTEWAAYGFSGYREGMAELDLSPNIRCSVDAEGVELQAEVALGLTGRWRIGLTAVLEAADGSLSYWAVRHPQGRPDFHHRDCFALELAPAG